MVCTQLHAVFFGQRSIHQHLGVAQNRVHRRADLVARVGQEFALGDVGQLGFLSNAIHFFVRALPRIDVVLGDNNTRRSVARETASRAPGNAA